MINTTKNYTKEFETIKKLEGSSKNYFRVPDDVILSNDTDKLRIALFLYLHIHKGINDIVNFSVPLFLKWAGYKTDRRMGGMNDKVLYAMDYLHDLGYVHYIDKIPTRASCVEIKFDTNLVHETCCSGMRFAIVYLDEIERILNFKNENAKDTQLNSLSVLLVFVYLRRSIYRRTNNVLPEERTEERIIDRRNRLPEAFNAMYIDIANEIGLSARLIERAVNVLQKMVLIVVGTPNRIQLLNGEFRTPDSIFANYEKRDGENLLAYGMEYAKQEIKQKAKLMYDYHIKYGVKYFLKEIA